MDVARITKELVGINSENHLKNEVEIAKIVNGYLENFGIDSKIIRYDKCRANVVAVMGEGEGLMLNGHLDTVPLGDENRWHFEQGEEKRGRIYGRGAADMKGGVASIVSAVSKIDQRRLRKKILVVFVSDEEAFCTGSNYLLSKAKDVFGKIKCGIIAEPTDMNIQIAQKGAVAIRASVFGRPAHGSSPWDGENAIVHSAELIVELERLSKKMKKDKFLGRSSINIGTVNGGTAANIVPDKCVIEIDRRIIPGESGKTALEEVDSIIRKGKIRAEASLVFEAGAYSLDRNSHIARLVKEASGSDFSVSSGYTEAQLYKRLAGIDSVVFGPGKKSLSHKYDEYVSISSMQKSADVFERVMKKFAY
jgi:acetylornithine deacetylase/succinyl-diaminopimelate desuccinylase family protein